ncbi:protein translocase subunit SecDF [Lacibacter luteus]|uniref:Multifunctional fusion protein n=1 Tax=Lacibacter luteus TaxID=2508719 RepID=A0A4Q1CLF4_9BACT|nr:protein translocase subunit SecDF [Lacibacter luteus]RXK61461.1 protein translocase subunit SecDF [Lacibacter luteus]
MALKGLVRFFAIVLIIISVWQLSYTWIVNNFEKTQKARAEKFVKNNFGTASKESKDSAVNAVYRRYIDSLKEKVIMNVPLIYPNLTYQKAVEQELNLGLDLQGGMNVTLEVGLDGLISSMSNNPKDVTLKNALASATQRKENSDADFVTLFGEEYSKATGNGRLAPLFAGGKNKTLKIDASNTAVLDAIRVEARDAIKRTYDRLMARIDQFGVAQPNVSYDENKGIINVELAGIDDPVRVRKFLQATANLEFWETYSNQDPVVGQSLQQMDAKVKAYLSGTTDSTKVDSNGVAIKDTTKTATAGDQPVTALISQQVTGTAQGYSSATIGLIRLADTATFSNYINLDVVKASIPSTMRFMYGAKPTGKNARGESLLEVYVIKTVAGTDQPKLSGEFITDARQDFDQRNNEVQVQMEMNSKGASIWEKMTGDAFSNKYAIAIALDNYVYSAPGVNNGAISGGISQISGNFSIQEAQDLASVLRTGKLPAPAHIVAEQVVGPTLGAEAVKGGSMSFIISFAVIFILMLVYYNTGGWVANIALILNLLFTIGVLSAFGATLTAAGIAGLVLTIGMAVDTNVIIFERIKEELTKGKSYQMAVEDGYKRSLAPVLDAHVTTLLTALILLYFGLGPVKGFATTQIIGILLSLFCGILVSRLITDFWTNKKRHFEYFTAVSRRIFKHAAYKFIEYRKIAYGISLVVLLLGIAAIFNGFDYGVEFRGGRSYTVKFDREMNNEEVANALNKEFGKFPIIKTVGTSKQLNITTDYLIEKQGQGVDAQVEAKLFEGLKSFLPSGITYAQFDTQYKQSSQTVQATISDDLKKGALWATILGLLAITLYIFVRFRDYRYSVGTIIALMHDVLVTLIVFSFLRNIVPFPLEIDQHFIAAILTVIGFSMNDTVIVFDRVREYSAKMFGQDKGTILNKAINDTLARTIMTSLTVFLTLLILFIFGGEVTRGFAFAMLIGVVTGTYSSIFVAAPILMDFAKDKPLGEPEKDKTLAKARHSIS